QDNARFSVLLERLRDDLVEGWHEIEAYEGPDALLADQSASITNVAERVQKHIKTVFRPAMHWVSLAGMHIVKNNGPIVFLDAIADLLKEVYDISHKLFKLQW